MLTWSRLATDRSHRQPPSGDPEAERAVAERLVPNAREVLVAPGAQGAELAFALVERPSTRGHADILCQPEASADLIARLLARGFVVYDTAAVSKHSVLVLDRRLGWRLPTWEPLTEPTQTAHRLLWTRLGYYTLQSGTVDSAHPENRLFAFRDRALWVNTAYRDLPLPRVGDRVRVLGMFSFLGSTLPILHALRIEAALDAPPSI